MSEFLSIPHQFNGPVDCGNGGYCAGVFAHGLEGTVNASLRRPVPLGAQLELVREPDDSVRVLDGEALVAELRATSALDVDVPPGVSLPEARRATEGYRGASDGPFSRCFVCGRGREDSFGVFAGAVEGRHLVAAPWTPPLWTADAVGAVLPEFIWAVLDCPTYFAAYMDGAATGTLLVQQTTRIDTAIAAGQEHVVIAWPIGADGRKRHAGSAVLSPDGKVYAVAQALLIEPRAQ